MAYIDLFMKALKLIEIFCIYQELLIMHSRGDHFQATKEWNGKFVAFV